ncbi:MAG: hypothetical protein ABEH43_06995, partial [Flavobacteriales bacterium]
KWSYKGQTKDNNPEYYKKDVYHIGPMASEFKKTYGLGYDDKHINNMDISSLSLVGVKALNQKVKKQKKIIEQLKHRISELEKTIK